MSRFRPGCAWASRPLAVGLLVGASLVPSARAAATQDVEADGLPVVELELTNGMRFLVLPRHGAPTASFVVQYRIGGVNEVLGTTGIAHLLEHLLFKGTSTIGTRDAQAERLLFARMDVLQDSILAIEAAGNDTLSLPSLRERIRAMESEARVYVLPNEFDRVLSTNGARGLNATTDWESTTYFVELPANRVELWFLMESERMRDPVFREFYSERDVVAEERRLRVETQPGGLLYEAHMSAAFTMHPYGQPVVGYMSDINRLSRSRVEDYYRRYYGPNNAVVAITGDVDPDQMLSWAEQYFGDIPPGDAPPPVLSREPAQRGERRVDVVFGAEPQVRIGWHVVAAAHPDTPALAILTTLLTGGRTSRLYRRLVTRERIATSVTSSIGPGIRFPQVFAVDATPRFPHSTLDVESAVYEEIEALRREPPSDVELERIRNQLEAGQVRRLTSNLGLAFQLAASASVFGDWRVTFEYANRLMAVTPSDVSRVVGTYFRRGNRTVATLTRPDSTDGR